MSEFIGDMMKGVDVDALVVSAEPIITNIGYLGQTIRTQRVRLEHMVENAHGVDVLRLWNGHIDLVEDGK